MIAKRKLEIHKKTESTKWFSKRLLHMKTKKERDDYHKVQEAKTAFQKGQPYTYSSDGVPFVVKPNTLFSPTYVQMKAGVTRPVIEQKSKKKREELTQN